ncbi:MAG: hypothetical protein V3S98_02720 [Dehalococcoidia bacterium]
MTISLSQFLAQLRTINRFVLAFWTILFVLVVYYGFAGNGYWGSYLRSGELQDLARQFAAVPPASAQGGETAQSELDAQLAILDQRTARISYATTDELIALLVEVAREERVTLGTVSLRTGPTETVGPMTYETRTADLRPKGRVRAIYSFIEALSVAAPSATIEEAQFGDLDTEPFGNLKIKFFVNPVPSTESD